MKLLLIALYCCYLSFSFSSFSYSNFYLHSILISFKNPSSSIYEADLLTIIDSLFIFSTTTLAFLKVIVLPSSLSSEWAWLWFSSSSSSLTSSISSTYLIWSMTLLGLDLWIIIESLSRPLNVTLPLGFEILELYFLIRKESDILDGKRTNLSRLRIGLSMIK